MILKNGHVAAIFPDCMHFYAASEHFKIAVWNSSPFPWLARRDLLHLRSKRQFFLLEILGIAKGQPTRHMSRARPTDALAKAWTCKLVEDHRPRRVQCCQRTVEPEQD